MRFTTLLYALHPGFPGFHDFRRPNHSREPAEKRHGFLVVSLLHRVNTIFRDDDEESQVQRMPSCGKDSYFRRDSRVHNRPDVIQAKDVFQRCADEGVYSRLANDDLLWPGPQLGDGLPSRSVLDERLACPLLRGVGEDLVL